MFGRIDSELRVLTSPLRGGRNCVAVSGGGGRQQRLFSAPLEIKDFDPPSRGGWSAVP